MSDSEDAFESADEGGEEKTEPQPKKVESPTKPKEEVKKSPSAATGGAVSGAQKGKKGKGKQRKGKGPKGRDQQQKASGPADKEDVAPPAIETPDVPTNIEPKVDKPTDTEKEVDLTEKTSTDEIKSTKKDEEKDTPEFEKEPVKVEKDITSENENRKKENDEIVEKMSDLNIDREVPDDREESTETKNDDSKTKRDITPTRKVERRPKPDAEQSDILDRLSGAAEKQQDSGGGWGWGSWGSSILSTATKSVTTFTSQVGEGFNTVLETVESSLGAPTPEEVAQQQRAVHTAKEPSKNGAPDSNPASDTEEEAGATAKKEEDVKGENVKEEKEKSEPVKEEDSSSDWFSSWGIPSGISKVVESTTKAVESTSKTLVVGGLDVLESIGKKTYDALAEGDHGLKSTLKSSGAKPNLSQMLREAKEEADHKAKENEEFEEARKAHFGALFDDFSGLAHLEGLEMVSNQCEGKVQSLLGSLPPDDVAEIKPDLINVKDEFDLDQHEDDEAEDEVKEHEFKQLVTEHLGNIGLNLTPDKLIQVQGRGRHWLDDTAEEQGTGVRVNAKEIHQMGIQSLAELTACSVESFHKMAQLLQVTQTVPVNTYKFKASNLKILTLVLGTEVDILSAKFTECLNTAADDAEEPDSVNPLITNIYLEASNSKTYIQDAFQLLLPVLQHAALRSHANS